MTASELIPLRAGPLTMQFDAENVFLRYLRLGEHEVLRGINAPIRPHDWSTVGPKVANLKVNDSGDHFRVTFDVLCEQKETGVDFQWKGAITGTVEGKVEFTFDGEAHSDFERNRIGFCILHGPDAAGQAWLVEMADGKSSEGQFPKSISPHQPAKNLKAITHEIAPGIRARVAFEGDVFEMEDQRNWTDASFKTYCTPLEIPYPVQLNAGDTVSQKISISLEGDLSILTSETSDIPVLTLSDDESSIPLLGLQVSGEVDDLTEAHVERFRALNLDHLRVDLALSDPSFPQALERAAQQAEALGVALQISLGLGDSPNFPALLSTVSSLNVPVTHWLITGGKLEDYAKAQELLTPVVGASSIGMTRITNFVDLNRNRPEDNSIEAVGFAINPQIHAFDDASMIETLEIHADAVNSTRKFTGDIPIVVGPVTLAPQWINGEDPPGGPPPGPFPTYVDARQGTDFTAAWTLGSFKYLTDAGTHSATFYETVGWNGVMDADDVSGRPQGYPSQPGQLLPVYHFLKAVGEFAGGTAQRVNSSNPLTTEAVALRKGSRLSVWIANLTNSPQDVSLRGLEGSSELSLSLPPYGIDRIDRIDRIID